LFKKHQIFLMLFFPLGEKMEWLVVCKISFEVEKTKYVLLARRRLLQFIAAGQNSNRMTLPSQAFSYLLTPLGVTAWTGWGKEVREKENPHLTCCSAALTFPILSALS
jgi:hypothetical protein